MDSAQDNSTSPQQVKVDQILAPETAIALVIPKETKLELRADFVTTVEEAFVALHAEAEEWRLKAANIVITSADQKREMKLARETRLALKEIRVKVEKKKELLKADAIKNNRAVDDIFRRFEALVKPIEADLQQKEDYVKVLEAARIKQLDSDRRAELGQYGDVSIFPDLGSMGEEPYGDILDTYKATKARKDQEAATAEALRIETERKAAEEAEERRKQDAANELELARLRGLQHEAEEKRREKDKLRADRTRHLTGLDGLDLVGERDLAEISEQEYFEVLLPQAGERQKAAQARDKLRAERIQAITIYEAWDMIAEGNDLADFTERAWQILCEQASARQEQRKHEREELEEQAAELARVKQAEIDRQAEIETQRARLAAAGDKAKLAHFAETLKRIEVPTLQNKAVETKLNSLLDDLFTTAQLN